MLKQLEIEALQADLEAVKARLQARTKQQDPLGFRQFSARKAEIERQLAEVQQRVLPRQEVGLLFGGTPVIGSRGIDAEFASRAVERFQQVVSAKRASLNGPVGQRGRIRGATKSPMLISGVARGSFGFILEQVSDTPEEDEALGGSIKDVVEFIHSSYSDSDAVFEGSVRDLDKRLLKSTQQFFRLLHGSGATLKVVSGDTKYTLQHEDVEKARFRIDRVKVSEKKETAKGRLYFIPSSRRFDLFLGGGETISGTISNAIIKDLMTETGMPKVGIADTWCIVELNVRKTVVRGEQASLHFQLINIISFGGKNLRDII